MSWVAFFVTGFSGRFVLCGGFWQNVVHSRTSRRMPCVSPLGGKRKGHATFLGTSHRWLGREVAFDAPRATRAIRAQKKIEAGHPEHDRAIASSLRASNMLQPFAAFFRWPDEGGSGLFQLICILHFVFFFKLVFVRCLFPHFC